MLNGRGKDVPGLCLLEAGRAVPFCPPVGKWCNWLAISFTGILSRGWAGR